MGIAAHWVQLTASSAIHVASDIVSHVVGSFLVREMAAVMTLSGLNAGFSNKRVLRM